VVERITHLPLNLDFYPEGTTVDVWVHLQDGPPVVLRDVCDALLHQGWWCIDYRLVDSARDRVTAMLLEDRVRYFTVVPHIASEPD